MKAKKLIIILLLPMILSCKNNESNNGIKIDTLKKTDSSINQRHSNKEVMLDSQHLSKRDYTRILKEAISKIKINKIDTEFIKLVIPLNEEEFGQFYGLTYNENTKDTFFKLDQLFYKYSKNEDVFLKYLNLAEFADGEYAESYFEDIDVLIYEKKTLFCKLYKIISTEARERLIDYKDLCK